MHLIQHPDLKDMLTITLGRSESRLIVFEKSAVSSGSAIASKLLPAAIGAPVSERTIAGPWNVRLLHVDGTTQTRVLQNLIDFSQHDDLKSFAGTMIYSNHFQVDHPDRHLVLDLGHLHSVSQLEINGRLIGTRWYGEHTYDLSGALRSRRKRRDYQSRVDTRRLHEDFDRQ